MYTLLEHDIDYHQIVQNVIEGKISDYSSEQQRKVCAK